MFLERRRAMPLSSSRIDPDLILCDLSRLRNSNSYKHNVHWSLIFDSLITFFLSWMKWSDEQYVPWQTSRQHKRSYNNFNSK